MRECVEYRLLDLYGLVEIVNKYERTFIYGAGMVGANIYTYLLEKGVGKKVECFLVTEKNGIVTEELNGLKIKIVEEMIIGENDLVLLAAKSLIRKDMLKKCKQLGIAGVVEINVYDERDEEYYMSLPESAYPIELEDWFKKTTMHKLNLIEPRTYNEKINWMKLYDSTPEKTRLADKYLVRQYIKDKIGEEYLIPILGVWDRFDDIDFDALPNKFVLKCNHGCGWNIIVQNKAMLDIQDAKRKIDGWMNQNFAWRFGMELHYKNIIPKIIAEVYIEDKKSKNLLDYKVHCFNGEPEFIQVIGDRDYDKHTGKQLVYDFSWRRQKWSFGDYPCYQNDLSEPKNLDELYNVSKKLCEGFSYVRIDFYILNRVYFGEMTFTPASGSYRDNDDWNSEINLYLGEKIHFK